MKRPIFTSAVFLFVLAFVVAGAAPAAQVTSGDPGALCQGYTDGENTYVLCP